MCKEYRRKSGGIFLACVRIPSPLLKTTCHMAHEARGICSVV